MFSLNIHQNQQTKTILLSFTGLIYERALIQNWLHNTPVFPIFAAEVTGRDNLGALTFERVSYGIDFPDVPHRRGANIQHIIDELRYNIGGFDNEINEVW